MAKQFYQWNLNPKAKPMIPSHGKLFIKSPVLTGNIKKPSSHCNIKSSIYVGNILSKAQDS